MPRRKRITQQHSTTLLLEEDSLPEDLEIPESEPRNATTTPAPLAEEPLFSALLRQAVTKLWPAMTAMCQGLVAARVMGAERLWPAVLAR